MTAIPLSTRYAAHDHRGLASRASLLYAASGLSWAAALIHLWAAPAHLSEWWGYGAFFLIAALCQGAFAVLLLRWPGRRLALAGAVGNLTLVSLYAATRTAGIPFFGPHAGEIHPVGTIDLICVAAELGLVAALVVLAGVGASARRYVVLGSAQALGAGAVLHLLHRGMHEAHGVGPVAHWLYGSAAMIPLSVLALWLATPLSRRLAALLYGEEAATAYAARVVWALTAAAAYAALGVPADGLAMQHPEAGSFLAQAGRDAGVTLGAAFLLLLAFAALRGTPWEAPRSINLWRPRAMATFAGLAAGVFLVVGPSFFGSALGDTLNSPAGAQQAAGQCNAASYDRSYDVAATNVEIPFNRWGGNNIDPHGEVFVLQGDKDAMKNWDVPLNQVRQGGSYAPGPDPADGRRLRPRPLVIRANAGECVKVDLTNELDAVNGDELPQNSRVGMKVFGPAYDAQTSDGSAVGYNKDTTVGRGEKISMFWQAPNAEGTFQFRDQAVMSGSEANSGSQSHGLYGAFVVEPKGSKWLDPETGQPLYAGATNHTRITKHSGDPYVDADIVPATGEAFRETVQMSQDELPAGNGFSFNYGAEPAFNRIATNPAGDANEGNAGRLAPDAVGEETSLSSWTFGDPSLIKLASGKGPWPKNGGRTQTEDCGLEQRPGGSCFVSNVTHAYKGDPTKIRFAHVGVKETHVFHLHAHQWRVEPEDGNSNIVDSQTYGPGESFTAELIGGAGSTPKTAGDSIFHCHLYPHFADGFWALLRVHDVKEDGTNTLPDGTNVRNLEPLPDRAAQALPTATEAMPGYPRFIPGKYGWRAPQPPDMISESNGQQDNANTIKREDLSPATRIVGSRPLDPEVLDQRTDAASQDLANKLKLEKNAMLPGANPGAPFAEPCPTGSREVTYNVSVIQTDVVYNERGDHDTQGRIMVQTEDVDEILAGTKKPEPLFIRVNAGDCINFNLTNHLPNWFGDDAFVEIAQTNMVGGHIHLVKFDVLASDGSSNGWNYQQAAFSDEQADFNKKVINGEQTCDWNGCRLENPHKGTWDPTINSGQIPPGQTMSERWYADTELRTVFTHDHHFAALDQNRGYFGAMIVEPKNADFRNPKTGEFYLPGSGQAAGAPSCGSECVGNAAGTAMDVIGPRPGDDFREFGLAIQDFVSLTKKGGDPRNGDSAHTVNAPATPEHFPDADPGTMAINYRNAPFQYRQSKGGQATDPAHVFSSTVHGDPMTPTLEAYSEDPVRIRAIQGSQEEQHVMSVHGMRWREEPDDPNSPLIDSKAIGISEAFNFQVPKITCGANEATCAGDYLYGATATDDMYLGAWGILRARAKEVNSLLPLPDNVPQAEGQQTVTSRMAAGPPEAETPGTPCPTDAPSREFDVIAMAADIKYNEEGDHDPRGLMYTLVEPGETPQQAMARAKANPEPMVLRANEGDCIQVRLTNKLTNEWATAHGNAGTNGEPTLPTEPSAGTPIGTRVSLHPQLVKYDVRGSDGTAVGFNRDQTVGIDDTKVYRWYADDVNPGELGTTNLTDFGDVRGHRHHGLFAGLNIEPKGSTYHDPQTGDPIRSGAAADIRVPGAPDFREFTTFFQDGLSLHDSTNAPIEDPMDHPPTAEEPAGVGMDPEDMGEKGFNYSNAPFSHRLPAEQMGPDGLHALPHDSRAMADVFSSKVHGDPDTPIFRAFAGDDIRMRVLQGSDKPRQHSFQVSGASWRAQPNDPNSNVIGTQGGVSVGRAFNLHLPGFDSPGDYRYGSGVGFTHISGGLWGMLRVYPEQPAKAALNPTPLRATDNPLTLTNHPILPLEVSRIDTKLSLSAQPARVKSGQSTELTGKLVDAKGRPAANMPLVLMQRPEGSGSEFTKVATAKTRSTGAYTFAGVKVRRTTDYEVRFAGNIQKGLSPSTSPLKRVIVRGA